MRAALLHRRFHLRVEIDARAGCHDQRHARIDAHAGDGIVELDEPEIHAQHDGADIREDGTVQIDKSKCIGCRFCALACPYGVRYLNEEERVVEKCTMCEQRISQGELPQCVAQCGARARFFGDLDKGIDSSEAPWVVDVTEGDPSYDKTEHTRITLKECVQEYKQSDVHHLPDVGNDPSFVYILRDRDWQGEE